MDLGETEAAPMSAHQFGRKAFEAIEQLERTSTTANVMAIMQRTLAPFGVEFFCFNTFPLSDQRFEEVMLASQVPAEWLELYVKEQYVHVDPSIRFCRRTVHPFEWKDAPYDPKREPRSAELVQRATDFGLSRGFLVPIPGPAGCEGDVWMGGYKLDLTACNKPMIQLLALYAFERVRSLHPSPPPPKPRLTAREREVLAWVMEGKSAWEIGEILNIAKRTVDAHVQISCRKLRAANRTQAVALALRQGLLGP
ncbi:MAG: LuxR family transcriptional regulator, quorum-sensing system regulator BjaR1 [Bradyrhizobium sp.]|nr:LuxR family transcriptional regulator, quorum-sensing system regulator BjaR1 [Bradyrhizobium sp.]